MSKRISCRFIPIAFVLFFTACPANEEADEYLRSLKISTIAIAPSDSIDLEQFNIYDVRRIEKFDDIFAISYNKGDHCLALLNPSTLVCRQIVRRGRGPMEMSGASSFHKSGNRGILYDWNSAVLIGIDIERSFESGLAVMDTIVSFGSVAPRPYYLCKAGNGVVSGNVMDPEVWYSYFSNSGGVSSSVPAIGFSEIKDTGHDFLTSMMLSSIYAASPDGRKVCVANVSSASISFSSLENGMLNEFKRYEMCSPAIARKGSGIVFSSNASSCFHCISSDNDDEVFLLYSGNPIKGKGVPANECSHLIIYGWDGIPRRHYNLTARISGFCFEDGKIYGCTSFPEARIYVFDVEAPER